MGGTISAQKSVVENGAILPDYVLSHVFGFLRPCTLLRARLVCRRWRALSSAIALWSNVTIRVTDCTAHIPQFIYMAATNLIIDYPRIASRKRTFDRPSLLKVLKEFSNVETLRMFLDDEGLIELTLNNLPPRCTSLGFSGYISIPQEGMVNILKAKRLAAWIPNDLNIRDFSPISAQLIEQFANCETLRILNTSSPQLISDPRIRISALQRHLTTLRLVVTPIGEEMVAGLSNLRFFTSLQVLHLSKVADPVSVVVPLLLADGCSLQNLTFEQCYQLFDTSAENEAAHLLRHSVEHNGTKLRLKSMRYLNRYVSNDNIIVDLLAAFGPTLEVFQITDSISNTIVSQISALAHYQKLRCLVLRNPENFPILPPSIEELMIHFSINAELPKFSGFLENLTKCPSLRTLRLLNCCTPSTEPLLLTALNSLMSQIRTLEITSNRMSVAAQERISDMYLGRQGENLQVLYEDKSAAIQKIIDHPQSLPNLKKICELWLNSYDRTIIREKRPDIIINEEVPLGK